MRVVEVGCFLLPVRFSLSALMAEAARDRITDAVASALPECRLGGDTATSELLLDYHRSQGARQMESMVFEGAVVAPGLGLTKLYISSLSIGFVVVELELPEDTVVDLETTGSRRSFKELEEPLSQATSPLVADWSERITRAVPDELVEARPRASLPAGRLLWWHRVAVNPPAGQEFPAARWYGVRADLADGAAAIIGNGFSLAYGDPDTIVDDIVEGLMVTTQEWLILDEAKRLLSAHLIRLSRTRDAGLVSVDAQYLEVLQLTEEVTLRNLVLAEEVRYLANARMRVREATATAWRMSQEAAELESRTAALRDLFGLHRERITNNRDDGRNRLIVVLTVITLIQGVLVWYDFLTQDNTAVAASPRPVIAIAVALITVVTLLAAFSRRLDPVHAKVRTLWYRLIGLTNRSRAGRIPAPRPPYPPDVTPSAASVQGRASVPPPLASPLTSPLDDTVQVPVRLPEQIHD